MESYWRVRLELSLWSKHAREEDEGWSEKSRSGTACRAATIAGSRAVGSKLQFYECPNVMNSDLAFELLPRALDRQATHLRSPVYKGAFPFDSLLVLSRYTF